MSESPSLSFVAAHDVAAVPSEKRGEREEEGRRNRKRRREKRTSTDKPSTADMDC